MTNTTISVHKHPWLQKQAGVCGLIHDTNHTYLWSSMGINYKET